AVCSTPCGKTSMPVAAWPLRGESVRPQRTISETRLGTPLRFQFTSHMGLGRSPGSCRIIVGRGRTYGKWGRSEMRALLSTHRPRGDVEPMVGLAAQSRALGGEGAHALVK